MKIKRVFPLLYLPVDVADDCDVVNVSGRDAVVEGEVAADQRRKGRVVGAVVNDRRLVLLAGGRIRIVDDRHSRVRRHRRRWIEAGLRNASDDSRLPRSRSVRSAEAFNCLSARCHVHVIVM